MPATEPTIEEINRRLCERRLPDFIREAWHVIEPGNEYLHNWHIDCICDYLQAVDAGQITRLLINMPPRYMKSICVSVMWPVWSWIRRPQSRWLFASYSQDLSTQHSVDRRTIIQSEWYQDRWRDCFQLTSDQNVKTEYRNNFEGRMFATGFGGAATGKGGDRIIIDDPHDPNGADSEIQRETALTTFRRKLSTRLNNKKTGAIVVVMQRLNEKDVSSLCMEEGYTHLCLPCEDSPGKTIVGPSGNKYHRDDSGLLWPSREGEKQIAQAKIQLGPYGYAGQYQQRPAPLGGGRFKEAWFRYFEQADGFYKLYKPDGSFKAVKVSDCDRFPIMDPAGTDKEQNKKACYTCIGFFDITPDHDLLWFDNYREQVETPEAADAAIRLSRHHDCPWIGVEKDGIGLGLVQNIRRKGVTVRAIKARGSKEARSETAEIRMSAGMIYFLKDAPWLFALKNELLQFPNGEFKDQVDVLAHASIWVQKTRGAPQTTEDAEYVQAVDARDRQAAEDEANAPAPEPVYARDVNPNAAFAGWGDDDD